MKNVELDGRPAGVAVSPTPTNHAYLSQLQLMRVKEESPELSGQALGPN